MNAERSEATGERSDPALSEVMGRRSEGWREERCGRAKSDAMGMDIAASAEDDLESRRRAASNVAEAHGLSESDKWHSLSVEGQASHSSA